MVQMAFCDLSHTYHKQANNVSPACFCHSTVGNFDVSPKICVLSYSLKARFYELTNHDDERNKTADEWKLTKKIG